MKTHKLWSHILRSVVSLFLGMTALVVSFAAGSAFEIQGTNSMREVVASCVATALYLAFCQFWVAPRGRGRFVAALPTVIASVIPLLVFVQWTPRAHGIPWGLVSGCLGGVIGALIAHRLTAPPQPGTLPGDSLNRASRSRSYLLAGFILLVAMAVVIPLGVIPSVLADTTSGIDARACAVFLWITVGLDLLAAAVLAFVLWHSREHDHFSTGTIGITAFLALLLALAYAGASAVSEHGPALRTALLVLCAGFGLITTGLMTVTSVIVDRARLSTLDPVA